MIGHALRELAANWREPYWWHHRFWERVGRYAPAPGVKPAIEYDWDVLLVLDGCRYDTFRDTIPDYPTLQGRTHIHWSQGSTSDEWLEANFGDRSHTDIAVVTANPYYHTALRSDTFGVIDHVWADDRWDDDLGTVWPGDVADAAREMAAHHPHKRLVVHFMQPHYPFLNAALGGGAHGIRGRAQGDASARSDRPVWAQGLTGELDWADIKAAYTDNLRIVLDELTYLVPDLDGQVVITADHGNAFGEKILGIPLAGHPKVPHYTLRKVPWHVVGERHRVGRD